MLLHHLLDILRRRLRRLALVDDMLGYSFGHIRHLLPLAYNVLPPASGSGLAGPPIGDGLPPHLAVHTVLQRVPPVLMGSHIVFSV